MFDHMFFVTYIFPYPTLTLKTRVADIGHMLITAPISRNTMKQTSSAIQPFCEAEAGLSRLKSENGTISDEFGQAQPVEKKMSNKN